MQNAHVLDVGCGLGVDSILAYTHFNARVVAFDLAEKQIKHCQKRSTELRESRRFDFVACDVEDMGLVSYVAVLMLPPFPFPFPLPPASRVVLCYSRLFSGGSWYIGCWYRYERNAKC